MRLQVQNFYDILENEWNGCEGETLMDWNLGKVSHLRQAATWHDIVMSSWWVLVSAIWREKSEIEINLWAGLPSTGWPSCCCLGSLPCLLAWVRDVLLMTNSIYLINIYPFPCIFTIHIHHSFILIHFIHHHSFSPISYDFHIHCQGRQEDYIVYLYYHKDGQRLFVASRGRFRYQRKRFQITVKVAANISEN